MSYRSIQDLNWRKSFLEEEMTGRPITPPTANISLRTDAADVAYGGKLNMEDVSLGVRGSFQSQEL